MTLGLSRLIAIVGALPNTRNLVQQIGRADDRCRAPKSGRRRSCWHIFKILRSSGGRVLSITEATSVRVKLRATLSWLAYDDFVSAHAKTPSFIFSETSGGTCGLMKS